MIYGKFVQTIPNNSSFDSIFDEGAFNNVFSIMDENHLFADSSFVSIQEKYDMLLEGVIGDIFEGIKNAIKKFFEWIKSFFSKLFKKKSDSSDKIKKMREDLEKALNRPLADCVEPFKKILNESNYVKNGKLLIIMDNNWIYSILNENPDFGTDFINKILSIISDGYKKNIKNIIPNIEGEIEKIQHRIYTPDFSKFISHSGMTDELLDEYIEKKISNIIFSASDSDSILESKLEQFAKKPKCTTIFDFKAIENKISKFTDDVNKVIDSLKKDFNKLTKEFHPDTNKADDSDEKKDLKSNYMVCLNIARDFFKKIASEFQRTYTIIKEIDMSNDMSYMVIARIIISTTGIPM